MKSPINQLILSVPYPFLFNFTSTSIISFVKAFTPSNFIFEQDALSSLNYPHSPWTFHHTWAHTTLFVHYEWQGNNIMSSSKIRVYGYYHTALNEKHLYCTSETEIRVNYNLTIHGLISFLIGRVHPFLLACMPSLQLGEQLQTVHWRTSRLWPGGIPDWMLFACLWNPY